MGIVQQGETKDSNATSTLLPAIIEYFMPYKTTAGGHTSFKVALGASVAVSTIMGMSMIRSGKFSLDLKIDCMAPGGLDKDPFPLTYKKSCRSVPGFTLSRRKVPVNQDARKITPAVIDQCVNDIFSVLPLKEGMHKLKTCWESLPPTTHITLGVKRKLEFVEGNTILRR